jgi:hypothetical protein
MGEGRVGVAFEQSRCNHRMHPFRIAKHVVIPEADNAIPLRLDEPRPLGIHCFVVLAAVTFDHQASTMACEVHDIAAERHLPAKSSLGKGLAKQSPHSLLSLGRV